MSRRERILAIAVAALIGLFAIDRLVVQPLIEHFRDLSTQADDLEGQLRSARVLVDNRRIIRARWQSYREAGLEADEPTQRLRIQRALTEWAGQSGVDLANLSSGQTSRLGDQPFLEARFVVRGSGSFEAIVDFLHRLRRSPFPLRTLSCNITNPSNAEEDLSLQLTISTLRLDPEAEEGQARTMETAR